MNVRLITQKAKEGFLGLWIASGAIPGSAFGHQAADLFQEITPPSTGPGFRVGCEVAAFGDVAAVAAPGSSSLEEDPAGKLYLYVFSGGIWHLTAEFTGTTSEGIGTAMDLSSERLVYGEPTRNGGMGAVRILRRMRQGTATPLDDTWVLEAELSPSRGDVDTGLLDTPSAFGNSVAIDRATGNTIVVGAPFEGPGYPPVGFPKMGATYVFALDEGGTPQNSMDDQWMEVERLSTERRLVANHGLHVAVDDGTILASGSDFMDGANGTGIGVYRVDDSGTPREAVDDSISVQSVLTSSFIDADANFGTSLDICGDTVVVGARGANEVGAVAVFQERAPGWWVERLPVVASDLGPGALFGQSVAIAGDELVIGAPGLANFAGAAYVFQRDAVGDWAEVVKLVNRDPLPQDRFGWGVGISSSSVVVGAPTRREHGDSAGAAYAFIQE